MNIIEFDITPVPKPRMTRRDKWDSRPIVERYRCYKNNLQFIAAIKKFKMPESDFHIVFYLPIPKNIKGPRRDAMNAQKHQKRPDIDNLLKGFLDALMIEDSVVWDVRTSKLWGDKGKIVVEVKHE